MGLILGRPLVSLERRVTTIVSPVVPSTLKSVNAGLLKTDAQGVAKAYATLAGLAIGDAMGMPTQSLTRSEVEEEFEPVLATFYAARPDHPFAAGLVAGSVTDDTEQALILAEELLTSEGRFDPRHYARRLVEWEQSVRQRGLLDLLGPSTKKALLNIESGMDPDEAGTCGTTNGAAMRVAPVGIVCSSANVASLVDRVIEVSALTHNTPVALSGASAIATMISAGIDGAPLEECVGLSLEAVRLVEARSAGTSHESLSERIQRAVAIGRRWSGRELIDAVVRDVGTSLATEESVPAAFALLVANADDGWMACRLAASLGGDTDTIGAMTGAMCGALRGVAAFPDWAIEKVERVNQLDLQSVARDLARARR
ncbi:MAG: ADP-ribosylglycohydrolase family protein [Acidimicrobiales bacterium]